MTMDMDDAECSISINLLCSYLERYYGKKVIVLLDEYDTPMQEAYIHGYWERFTGFIRSFLNATFKTNACLERGIMTGITRVSKESIFSDLNNLNVVTTTSDDYRLSFGFTEEEVFASLAEYGLEETKDEVKNGMMDLHSEEAKIYIIHGPSRIIWIKKDFRHIGRRQVEIHW